MRRTNRPRSPGGGRVKGYGSTKEELLKRPRKSSHTGEGEPKERCARKNHHYKTYERCRQISSRLDPGGQGEAREPSRGVKVWDRTKAMGSPMRPNHGEDQALPDRDGAVTESSTGGRSRAGTPTHGDPPYAHGNAHPTQHRSSHTRPPHPRARSRAPSGSSQSSDSSGGKKRKSCDDDDGDEGGHLVYDAGLTLKERYEVVSALPLGQGAYAKVVECFDRNNDERVALKIVKNNERFREAAHSEIAVLEEINGLDDDDRFACVRMLDWFDHHGHTCIVFELLGPSTFDYLRENHFLPFSVDQIRHMAFQIFRAVCFLHRSKLTHTDLKPENILFVRSDCDVEYNDRLKREERTLRSLDVKVVDFGNATFDHEHHPSLVSTRHYRAPEVILELGWNQACDVWSLGCILMEFYLGLTLFQTHDSKEHLAMMERVLGPIPAQLLNKTRKRRYVDRERLDWDENSSSGRYVRKHCKPLKQYMQSKTTEHQQLFHLIGSMLEYDVFRRITLDEALWHPFFNPLRADRCA